MVEFLREKGIREATRAEMLMRVVEWQLAQEMERQGITKAALERLQTAAPSGPASWRRRGV